MEPELRHLCEDLLQTSWDLESIGPKLTIPGQFSLLESEIIEYGRFRTNVRGKFIEPTIGTFFHVRLADKLLTHQGITARRIRDKLRRLEPILFEKRDQFQKIVYRYEEELETGFHDADLYAVKEMPEEYRLAYLARRHVRESQKEAELQAIRDGRILRFSTATGRVQIVNPDLREDANYPTRHYKLMLADLHAMLINELKALTKAAPLRSNDSDKPLLDEMVKQLARDPTCKGNELQNRARTALGMPTMGSNESDARRVQRKFRNRENWILNNL